MPELPPSDTEILWRQYANHIDLYKFYMDLALKAFVFYYAITGAIISYYFAHESDRRMTFALLLPIVMSLALAYIFGYGAVLMKVVRDEVFSIADKLKLRTGVEVRVLVLTLWVYAAVLVVTAVAIGLFLGSKI
jgi:hypothetical protein